jgi:hypothetical protein
MINKSKKNYFLNTSFSKFIFLIISLLLFSSGLYAQNYVDLAKFYYANTPVNKFDSSEASTRVQEFGLDVNIPIVLKEDYVFLTGFTFGSSSASVSSENDNVSSVYTVLLKLGANIKHTEKWTGTYLFMPKLSSDLKKIGREDFQFGGLVLFDYARRPKFKYRFGLYYNSELFGPYFVPLFGIYYKSHSNKFEINATLPVWLDLNYRFATWFRLGANFSGLTRTFNINEPQFSEKGEYLVKQSNEIFLYGQFEVQKSFIIQAKIGYSIGRRYGIYDEKDKVGFGLLLFRFDDNRNQLNSDFADGMIFRIRLIYRFITV